jgi:hypothetical protein
MNFKELYSETEKEDTGMRQSKIYFVLIIWLGLTYSLKKIQPIRWLRIKIC